MSAVKRDFPSVHTTIGLDTLSALSQEVAAWRVRQNFASDNTIDPLIGALEEVCEIFEAEDTNDFAIYLGRMMKAYLKSKQGISGDIEKHRNAYEASRTGIGLILSHNCSSFAKVSEIVEADRRPNYNREKIVDGIGDVIIYLADYCARNDIDFGMAVSETWSRVSKRDWAANKLHAGDEEKIALMASEQ